MGKVNAGPDVNLNTLAMQALAPADQQCVESPEFIRANHMQLLNQWREESVRNGQIVYVNSQGKKVITYPRTDCAYLSEDLLPKLPGHLQAIRQEPFTNLVDEASLRGVPQGNA